MIRRYVFSSIFLTSSKTFVPSLPEMVLKSFVSVFFKVAGGLPLILLVPLAIKSQHTEGKRDNIYVECITAKCDGVKYKKMASIE